MRNLICWAVVLAAYGGLLAWGNSEPIAMQRGSRSAWARFWKVAEAAPVPGVSRKPPAPPRPPPPDPPMPLTRAEAEQVIAGSACTERASVITPRLRRSIRVSPVPVDEADDLAKGVSRMAAPPDVPAGFKWPQGAGRPLTLLAQINLSEVAAVDEDGLLPRTGWLCFFYALGADPAPTGLSPKDRNSWEVVYFDKAASSLQRMPPPKPTKPRKPDDVDPPPCRVRFWKEWTLPAPVDDRSMIDQDTCNGYFYMDLVDALSGRPRERGWHHLLGYSQNLGGPMREVCELASKGIDCAEIQSADDPKLQELQGHDKEWVLLFQVEPDALLELEAKSDRSRSSMMPSVFSYEGGRLYFWIREADLKARNFGRIWMVRQ
jgi:uncharacterized protein YwqG